MDTAQVIAPALKTHRARQSEGGGFASTAEYFLGRAKAARDEEARHTFSDVAAFYTTLAGIAPGFPPGFHGGRFVSNGTRYQKRAEECRAMAEHFKDANTRRMMTDLAATYDQ